MEPTSRDKGKALIQYICNKVPREFSGVVKLNKIMWFSEIETYFATDAPLTGLEYIRLRFGPVARDAGAMRRELIAEGKLIELPSQPTKIKGLHRRPFFAENSPNMEYFFTSTQIRIIDEQIKKYCQSGGMEVSDLSHDSIWISLEDGDIMPLELYVCKPVYTDEQKEKVKELANLESLEDYGDE